MGLEHMIDHTMLKADASKDTIIRYCSEAREHKFASVCVNTCFVPLVAEQLKRTFGNMQAFLARYGGDEFVVIVKGKTQDEMDVIIHQTQENVNAIAWGADTPWQLSISIGCAMRGEQGKQKSHELLALADERMYRQKKGIQDR